MKYYLKKIFCLIFAVLLLFTQDGFSYQKPIFCLRASSIHLSHQAVLNVLKHLSAPKRKIHADTSFASGSLQALFLKQGISLPEISLTDLISLYCAVCSDKLMLQAFYINTKMLELKYKGLSDEEIADYLNKYVLTTGAITQAKVSGALSFMVYEIAKALKVKRGFLASSVNRVNYDLQTIVDFLTPSDLGRISPENLGQTNVKQKQADLLIVLGSPFIDQTIDAMVKVCRQKMARNIIISGGIKNNSGFAAMLARHPEYKKYFTDVDLNEITEAEALFVILKNVLKQDEMPENIWLETSSKNTLENIRFCIQVLKQKLLGAYWSPDNYLVFSATIRGKTTFARWFGQDLRYAYHSVLNGWLITDVVLKKKPELIEILLDEMHKLTIYAAKGHTEEIQIPQNVKDAWLNVLYHKITVDFLDSAKKQAQALINTSALRPQALAITPGCYYGLSRRMCPERIRRIRRVTRIRNILRHMHPEINLPAHAAEIDAGKSSLSSGAFIMPTPSGQLITCFDAFGATKTFFMEDKSQQAALSQAA